MSEDERANPEKGNKGGVAVNAALELFELGLKMRR